MSTTLPRRFLIHQFDAGETIGTGVLWPDGSIEARFGNHYEVRCAELQELLVHYEVVVTWVDL